MLPEWTVVGFSGHRKLPDPPLAAEGIRRALDQLAGPHSPLAAVSSAASGGDTLFVEEVARRELPFLLILPFARSRFQQDFTPPEWERIRPLLERAAHVEEVAGEESDEAAYLEAGLTTADRADVLIVVWNGQPAGGLGGTADVVDYARSVGKPLLIVDPATGRIAEERLDRLPRRSVPAGWSQNPRETVEKYFRELDETAERHAPKSRHLVLRIILLQLLAPAIGFIALAFELHGAAGRWLDAVELILLGLAFILSLQHRRSSHDWVKNRIAAEICRSFLATWNLRRADYSPKISLGGFDRLCRNLRLIRILDKSPPLPLEAVRDQYLRGRVEDQLAYFSRNAVRARSVRAKLKRLALASTAAAALLSFLALACSFLELGNPAWRAPKYLSLLLPLASAAFFSLLITQDHARRAVRYGELAAMLENGARRLRLARTWNSVARVTQETEEALLQEIVEWHSFRQFAGEPR